MTTPAPRWMVLVDRKACTLCEVCAVRCPTQALKVEKRSDTQRLTFEPALCDACGGDVHCQNLCPEKCVEVVKSNWKRLPETAVLAAGKLVRCSDCGATFGARKKLQTVRRKSGGKRRVDLERRCPSCRRDHLLANLVS